MTKYEQTPGDGHCLGTCLGCLLDIDPKTIPNFYMKPTTEINNWLKQYGFCFLQINPDCHAEILKTMGYHIIDVKNSVNGRHAIIGYRGKPFYNPVKDAPPFQEIMSYGFLVRTFDK